MNGGKRFEGRVFQEAVDNVRINLRPGCFPNQKWQPGRQNGSILQEES